MRTLLTLAAAAAAIYLAVLALVWWQQERLLFHPAPLPGDHRFDFGPDVAERWIDAPDGARLHALHLQRPGARTLVFFLHGNAGHLQDWFARVDTYRRLDVDLFMLDYRGYGKSAGRIAGQAQLLDDVRAAWRAVAPQYAGRRIVVVGRSLGSGLAAALAAEVQPAATVLVSPYASMAALAGEHYRWLPVRALLRYPLPTDAWLPRIAGPVLLVHGERDTLIPPDHARRLLALRPQGTQLVLLPQAGHADVQDDPAYYPALAAVLR